MPMELVAGPQQMDAVVSLTGLSAMLPSGVVSLDVAAPMLSAGVDAISTVPAGRWELPMVIQEALESVSSAVAKRPMHGGFVSRPELFDASFFGVSVAESNEMDPQQRVLLERGYESLHDSRLDSAGIAAVAVVVDAAEGGRAPLEEIDRA